MGRNALLLLCILVLLMSAMVHSSTSPPNNSSDFNINGRKKRPRPPPPPSPPPPPPPSPPPPPPPFDYYILELVWPRSYCLKLNRPPCYTTVPQQWVIHGLWPNGFENCHPGDVLRTDKIKQLRPRLKKDWPSLLQTTPDDEFWQKQWSKHGTCSGLSQSQYFQQTIDFFDQIGTLKSILQGLKVKEGNRVNPSLITRKFPSFKPRIKCYDKTSFPRVEMMGVFHFKLYRNKTRDNMVEPTNCSSTLVEYPSRYSTLEFKSP